MKIILVTGGTGFIGSHTCISLLDRGFNILVVDSLVNSSMEVIEKLRKISFLNRKKSNKIEFKKGDLRDEIFLDDLFYELKKNKVEIEAVIHFAGLKAVGESTKNPLKYWDFNLKGTINLLNVMEKYEVLNLVFSSSATIYGVNHENKSIKEYFDINPINPYGNTKATIEKIFFDLSKSEQNEWHIVSLRYFNPIGAHSSGLIGEDPIDVPNNVLPIINNVAAGFVEELEIFGSDWGTPDGTGVRDYIHVMDVAEGHYCALEYILKRKSNYMQFNLGTGKGTSVLELVKTFEKVNNVKVPYKFSSRRNGDVAFSVADNSLAKKFLGWHPKRNLENMCIDNWRWFKNRSLSN